MEIAGNRVVCSPEGLHLSPFRQDLLVAIAIAVGLTWLGLMEVTSFLVHVLAALDIGPIPLGGVSATRASGHAIVGSMLVWLGGSALFRAGWTMTVRLEPGGDVVVHRLVLGLREVPLRSYARAAIARADVVDTGGPVDLVLRRKKDPARTESLLSLVPSVGRRRGLTQELGTLAILLNERLEVDRDDWRHLVETVEEGKSLPPPEPAESMVPAAALVPAPPAPSAPTEDEVLAEQSTVLMDRAAALAALPDEDAREASPSPSDAQAPDEPATPDPGSETVAAMPAPEPEPEPEPEPGSVTLRTGPPPDPGEETLLAEPAPAPVVDGEVFESVVSSELMGQIQDLVGAKAPAEDLRVPEVKPADEEDEEPGVLDQLRDLAD